MLYLGMLRLLYANHVYVIILNWNGWKDTLECLESLFRNDYPNFTVIVCDNASHGNDIEKIRLWANGLLNISAESVLLKNFSFPPIHKPIPFCEYTRIEAEKGGNFNQKERLVLIQTGSNLGFAGGNNVGLHYAFARNDFDYIWILNNDTVVQADSLRRLVERLKEKRNCGICGSTILDYYKPETTQALGGARYNKWLARQKHIGQGKKFNLLQIDPDAVEKRMDYVIGASMFVSKQFIKDVGLLSEEYFLYFEELDWAIRAKNRFTLAYAPKSIIYHKEGKSTGGNNGSFSKSYVSDYYSIRNRVLYTKKFYPYALFSVKLSLLGAIINRMIRSQWDRVFLIIKAILGR